MKKMVITYKNADLDCVASAYAYSKFLNKRGYKANYYISGEVQSEVTLFVLYLVFNYIIMMKIY